MTKFLRLWTMLAAMALLPGVLPAFQAGTVVDATKSAAKKTKKAAASVMPGPSDQEIAGAKAKGLVWANTNSKIYHKGGKSYGKTKQGKFMTEDDAKKAGYREARSPSAKSTKTTTKS